MSPAFARQDLTQPIYCDGKDHGVTDRLNHPDRDLESSSAEDTPVDTKLVGDLLSQLDLERFHAPGAAIEEKSGDLSYDLTFCRDGRSSSKILVRHPQGWGILIVFRTVRDGAHPSSP
jgi:hypothetical protein